MIQFFGSQSAQSQKSENLSQKKEATSPNEKIHNRFCTNCGAPLADDDLFCDECGSKIEQEESAIVIEEEEVIEEQTPVDISPDRMASILQTNRIKSGEVHDELKNMPDISKKTDEQKSKNSLTKKKSALLGAYVSRDSYMTQYLTIKNIQGNRIEASIKTIFDKGGYSTELYEGTLVGDDLHLHIVDSDLHPLPDEHYFLFGQVQNIHHSIRISENFNGVIGENTITGSYEGEYSKSVVFRKC